MNNFHSSSIHHTCYCTYLSTAQTQNVSVSRTDIKVIKMISQSTENYMCWVNNINDTLEPMTTTVLSTLEYDTIYSVGCVETKGQNHQCTEYSTTVLTGESACNRNNICHTKAIIGQQATDH